MGETLEIVVDGRGSPPTPVRRPREPVDVRLLRKEGGRSGAYEADPRSR